MKKGKRIFIDRLAKEGHSCPAHDGGHLVLVRERGFWLQCDENPDDHYREASDPEIRVIQERLLTPETLELLRRLYGC